MRVHPHRHAPEAGYLSVRDALGMFLKKDAALFPATRYSFFSYTLLFFRPHAALFLRNMPVVSRDDARADPKEKQLDGND